MILFQLCLTSKFVYIINDIEFDKHYVLQFIDHFFLELNKQEMLCCDEKEMQSHEMIRREETLDKHHSR
jgi:hypothetical protein